MKIVSCTKISQEHLFELIKKAYWYSKSEVNYTVQLIYGHPKKYQLEFKKAGIIVMVLNKYTKVVHCLLLLRLL